MQMQRIPSLNELDAQAAVAAQRYFDAAVDAIDEKFGDGFAKGHPSFVGMYMQTCANEYASAVAKWHIGDPIEAINGTLNRLVDAVEGLRSTE